MTLASPTRRIALAAIGLLLAACGAGSPSTAVLPPIPTDAPATPTPIATHPGPTYPPGCPTSAPAPMAKGTVKLVTVTTDKGTFAIKIEGSLAPNATGNFVALAQCGYYNNVVFFRADASGVLQGGDGQFGRSPDVIPDLVGSGGPPYTIKDDPLVDAFTRGTVAMANSGLGTTRSQFFVVTKDFGASTAKRPYPIVGHVVSGMDVVDLIASQPRGSGPGFLFDTPVVMTAVTVSNP